MQFTQWIVLSSLFEQPVGAWCTCTAIFGSAFKILYKDEGKEEDDDTTNSAEDEKLDIHDMESKQHFLILLRYTVVETAASNHCDCKLHIYTMYQEGLKSLWSSGREWVLQEVTQKYLVSVVMNPVNLFEQLNLLKCTYGTDDNQQLCRVSVIHVHYLCFYLCHWQNTCRLLSGRDYSWFLKFVFCCLSDALNYNVAGGYVIV